MLCTCSALRMAARRLTQAYDAALAPQGINTSQYALLSRLALRPAGVPTVKHLADDLGLDRTTLAHNLRPLERDGFVVVAADALDRRVRRVHLTILGAAKREACLPLWEGAQWTFGQTFGQDRTATLMEALASIAVARAQRPSETSHAG